MQKDGKTLDLRAQVSSFKKQTGPIKLKEIKEIKY